MPKVSIAQALILLLALALVSGLIGAVIADHYSSGPVQPGAVTVQNVFTTIQGTPIVILNGVVIFDHPFLAPTPAPEAVK